MKCARGTFAVLCIFVGVTKAFNGELLRQSIIYGISYLAEGNLTMCTRELKMLLEGVEVKKSWALKVLDSSGTPGPGFLWGNNFWLGNYPQCNDLSNRKSFEVNHINTKSPTVSPDDFPPFEMGFHVAHVIHNNSMQQHTQLPLEWTIQIGLCTPLSCNQAELTPLLQDYINKKLLISQKLFNLDLQFNKLRFVQTDTTWIWFTPSCILLIGLTSILTVLGIVACYLDNHSEKNFTKEDHSAPIKSEKEYINYCREILKCFSLKANAKSLTNTNHSSDSIPAIHGLKFFGMLWVILVHGIFFAADYIRNIPFALRLSESIPAQIVSNSTYSVDTFFFISGFLLGYLFYKSKKSFEKSSETLKVQVSKFCFFCFHRLLRLTPPYAMIILFSQVMFTYYRQNSVLYASEQLEEVCSKYWWRNLLYVNNLFPRTEMCLNWSWYVSADSQFFVIGTILLLISTTSFWLAATLTVFLIIINIVSVSFKSYMIGYIPTLDEQLRQLDAIYDLPWCRIGCYLTGIITAYIYVIKLQRKLELTKTRRAILWCLFPLPNLWIVFTLYTRDVSVEFSAVYMGISRTLWGIGLGWLVIACSTGNAMYLEKFLAYPGWLIFSKLTYCAYLLNPLVANMLYLSTNEPFPVSKAYIGMITMGIAYTTYIFAFILSLLVESPTIRLSKLMINKILKA